MSKAKILPKLAITGVLKNGTIYFPYIGAGIFSAFIFFVFASILHNDIMTTLPKSAYAFALLVLGQVLLCFIILPFLFYTNSFLMKRRKWEIGLYSVLGLEKKHIGIMMALETLVLYFAAVAGGILAGVVFAKLLFLLLLNMAGLPVEAEFTFSGRAFAETACFFAASYGINLLANLWAVGRARPVELMGGSKKGERDAKRLWIPALLGMAALSYGYKLSITAKMDSYIFSNFFLAVLLVVVATYFIFTAGSVVLLKSVKKNKKIYYRTKYFITVSGMLYRMKKNAASLSNICIFATMVMITLACTISLLRGEEGILEFDFPYDVELSFVMKGYDEEAITEELQALSAKYGIEVTETVFFPHYELSYDKDGNRLSGETERYGRKSCTAGWMSLAVYNRMMGAQETLEDGEALVFATGSDWEGEDIILPDASYRIKDRPQELKGHGKAEEAAGFLNEYFIVLKDEAEVMRRVEAWKEQEGVMQAQGSCDVYLMLEGDREAENAFMSELQLWGEGTGSLRSFSNNFKQREMLVSMNGGVLFIGIIFSATFLLCMVLIMYYKQIVEGYEDRNNFEIMSKVGMSDEETRRTIRSQILLVFFLPLIGALLHTLAGLPMVKLLFGGIRLYDDRIITESAAIAAAVIAAVYIISYRITARVYYRIVRQPQA